MKVKVNCYSSNFLILKVKVYYSLQFRVFFSWNGKLAWTISYRNRLQQFWTQVQERAAWCFLGGSDGPCQNNLGSSNSSRWSLAESEKPMWHGGIATWKVFARPESFCAYLGNPQLKDMPKAQISRWCGKCQDGLESLRMVWKVSKWTGKFPYGLENFRMVWKLSGW